MNSSLSIFLFLSITSKLHCNVHIWQRNSDAMLFYPENVYSHNIALLWAMLVIIWTLTHYFVYVRPLFIYSSIIELQNSGTLASICKFVRGFCRTRQITMAAFVIHWCGHFPSSVFNIFFFSFYHFFGLLICPE